MKKLMLLFFLVLLLTACKKTVEVDAEIVEILAPECGEQDQDTCCEQECISFCQNLQKSYSKHVVNGAHCPCWCD